MPGWRSLGPRGTQKNWLIAVGGVREHGEEASRGQIANRRLVSWDCEPDSLPGLLPQLAKCRSVLPHVPPAVERRGTRIAFHLSCSACSRHVFTFRASPACSPRARVNLCAALPGTMLVSEDLPNCLPRLQSGHFALSLALSP